VGDHFRESTVDAIGGVRQAKVFEDLEEALLLIKETEVFLGALGLTEQAAANDRQSTIA
jgi:hypothetical protein